MMQDNENTVYTINLIRLELDSVNESAKEYVLLESIPNLLAAFHFYMTAKADLKKCLPKSMRSCKVIVLEIVDDTDNTYMIEPKTYSDLYNYFLGLSPRVSITSVST